MEIQQTGVMISKKEDFSDFREYTINGGQVGLNSIPVDGLEPDTTYYTRGFFINDGAEVLSENVVSFSTASVGSMLRFTNTANATNTITITKFGTPSNEIHLRYSTNNGAEWTDWDSGEGNLSVELEVGESVIFCGDNNAFSSSENDYYCLGTTDDANVTGNVMSLIDSTRRSKVIPTAYCFCKLFCACVKCDFDVDLPATTLTDYCYEYMFISCQKLTKAPKLPATELSVGAYYGMFWSCIWLTDTPALVARDIPNYGYYGMFGFCQNLINAPSLPATRIGSYSYYTMFTNCYALKNAPYISATSMGTQAMANMFYGCSGLVNAPRLSATTLSYGAYAYMFYGGTSLTTAPALPATTLANDCYEGMFKGCTSLINPPDLNAQTYTSSSYKEMFYGCTSLNRIKVRISQWNTTNSLNWMYDVAPTGDFYDLGRATNLPIDDPSGVPVGWTLHQNDDPTNSLLSFTNTAQGARTLSLVKYNNPQYTNPITVKYSLDDGSTWTSWSSGTTSGTKLNISIPAGGTCLFKGDSGRFSGAYDQYFYFSGNYPWQVYGNVMSLIDSTLATTSFAGKNYIFTNLFRGLSSATFDVALPATTLSAHCYDYMFYNCRSLRIAPKLPATVLTDGCYSSMFYGCSSLISAPSLPAGQIAPYCYECMFEGCTSLVNPPAELPAVSMKVYCYEGMFYGCTALTHTPILRAVSLSGECYRRMFANCSSLNTVTTYATNLNSADNLTNWLYGVAATGDFYNLGSATYPSGDSGIPSGWTEHTSI